MQRTVAPIMPPILPSIVLLGLIFVNLCFPNNLPVIIADMSVEKANRKIKIEKGLPEKAVAISSFANNQNGMKAYAIQQKLIRIFAIDVLIACLVLWALIFLLALCSMVIMRGMALKIGLWLDIML